MNKLFKFLNFIAFIFFFSTGPTHLVWAENVPESISADEERILNRPGGPPRMMHDDADIEKMDKMGAGAALKYYMARSDENAATHTTKDARDLLLKRIKLYDSLTLSQKKALVDRHTRVRAKLAAAIKSLSPEERKAFFEWDSKITEIRSSR